MLNENISNKFLLLLLIIVLSGCGSSNFPLDGFKSVKFDMSSSQLEKFGFSCTQDKKSCKKDKPLGDPKPESSTLFGQAASLKIDLSDDKVSCITVFVSMEDRELIELYENALGKPKTFQFNQIFTGNKIQKNYWVSADATSIAVTEILNKEPPQGLFKMLGPSSAATYCNKSETAKLIDEAKKASIKPKDF